MTLPVGLRTAQLLCSLCPQSSSIRKLNLSTHSDPAMASSHLQEHIAFEAWLKRWKIKENPKKHLHKKIQMSPNRSQSDPSNSTWSKIFRSPHGQMTDVESLYMAETNINLMILLTTIETI